MTQSKKVQNFLDSAELPRSPNRYHPRFTRWLLTKYGNRRYLIVVSSCARLHVYARARESRDRMSILRSRVITEAKPWLKRVRSKSTVRTKATQIGHELSFSGRWGRVPGLPVENKPVDLANRCPHSPMLPIPRVLMLNQALS